MRVAERVARRHIASSSGGILGLTVRGGGGGFWMWLRTTAMTVSPENGIRPVKIS